LEQTINLLKITTNDTASGQQSTASIIQSERHLGGGLEKSIEEPYTPERSAYFTTQLGLFPAAVDGYARNQKVILNPDLIKGYPDNNPKTAEGMKKLPLELVPPSAVAALAEAFSDGAKKYGPYNWREKSISSNIYYGASLRHLQSWWDGEDLAEDSGIDHLHHALACISMLIDAKSIGKLNDNRPPKGAASQMQKDWLNGHSK
jgi:hypothetical protein